MATRKPGSLLTIEREFLDAIDRIRLAKPHNKQLKKKAEMGLLKLTISNVAREAGRSRTLIGFDECRFPRIRELILKNPKHEASTNRTAVEAIADMRRRIEILRRGIRGARAEAVKHFLARRAAEREAARWKSAYERVRDHVASRDDKVVPFKRPNDGIDP